jgi:hypothetical protein
VQHLGAVDQEVRVVLEQQGSCRFVLVSLEASLDLEAVLLHIVSGYSYNSLEEVDTHLGHYLQALASACLQRTVPLAEEDRRHQLRQLQQLQDLLKHLRLPYRLLHLHLSGPQLLAHCGHLSLPSLVSFQPESV